MLENFAALAAIILLSTVAHLLYRNFLDDAQIIATQHWQRHLAWLGITAAAFLSFNYWIFIASAAAITYWAASKEHRPLLLWISILLAAPGITRKISGLGLFNHLFAIDYTRLITLVVLLPVAYKIYSSTKQISTSATRTTITRNVDIAIIGFIAVQLMLRLNIDSLTNTIRYGFYALVDIGLPYYVASRIANNHTALKQIIYTIWYACLVTALLAIYETATNKLLYESLQTTLNQYWGYGRTLMRGDRLRAQTITGQPIALGYVMMIGLSMHCFVAGQKLNKTITQIASIALVGGLIASISRGPWIGAAAAIVTYAALSAKSLGSIFKFTIATIAVSVVVLNSPWADAIKSHLPFIGTVENENITYRQNLLEFSIQVIAQNPFFGAYDYLYHPALQSLRQETANGLIDVVNTYVGIAMSNGLVGLTFFLGAFLLSTLACWRRMKATSSTDTWERNIGRTLIAAIVGIMVTIFTTSSITVIPTFYWLIIGLAVAYARLADSKVTATQAAAQPDIGKPQKNATIWAGTPTPPHA